MGDGCSCTRRPEPIFIPPPSSSRRSLPLRSRRGLLQRHAADSRRRGRHRAIAGARFTVSLRHQHHQQRARGIRRKLQSFGIAAEPHEIFRPAVAAAAFLIDRDASGVFFMTADSRAEFDGVREDVVRPDYVVLGDLGDEWSYAQFNQALRYLLNGSRLIALGMSRYWRADDGPRLDVGPIASALRLRDGHSPIVLGKPSHDFFLLARAISTSNQPTARWSAMTSSPTSAGRRRRACAASSSARASSDRQDLECAIRPEVIVDSIADLNAKRKSYSSRRSSRFTHHVSSR